MEEIQASVLDPLQGLCSCLACSYWTEINTILVSWTHVNAAFPGCTWTSELELVSGIVAECDAIISYWCITKIGCILLLGTDGNQALFLSGKHTDALSPNFMF